MTLLDARDPSSANQIGEDTCELFEAIEESFGVKLGDYHDLAGITIGDLAHRIETLAQYPAEEACLTLVAFFTLRRSVEKLTCAPRSSLRPSTPVALLFPWKNRHKQWMLLQEELGLTLPKLQLPAWLLTSSLFASVASMILAPKYVGLHPSVIQIASGSIFLFAGLIWIVCQLPARTIPPNSTTLGDLSKAILARNYEFFAKTRGSSYKHGVLPSLQLLVAAQAGYSTDEVYPDTRIPADLDIY
jgi:hypothetical protein